MSGERRFCRSALKSSVLSMVFYVGRKDARVSREKIFGLFAILSRFVLFFRFSVFSNFQLFPFLKY